MSAPDRRGPPGQNRGGSGGQQQQQQQQQQQRPGGGFNKSEEKQKKAPILDLARYIDKKIRVKYVGGREASGTLKGFDPLMNLVLDDTKEFLRDLQDPTILTDNTRELGLVVVRGTSIMLICAEDGMEEIANPFLQQE